MDSGERTHISVVTPPHPCSPIIGKEPPPPRHPKGSRQLNITQLTMTEREHQGPELQGQAWQGEWELMIGELGQATREKACVCPPLPKPVQKPTWTPSPLQGENREPGGWESGRMVLGEAEASGVQADGKGYG